MIRALLLLSQLGWLPLHASGFPLLSLSPRSNSAAEEASQSFRATWENPSDTMSILLIIGGDVVLKALAQLSGRPFVPVAFSFGWVAYSFNTLMSVCGDGRLMPPPDHSAKLINAKTGFVRDSRSWVLGRLLRDFDCPLPGDVGLCVTVFEASNPSLAGVPTIDWCWWSGVITILLQLCIAAIPCGLDRDWNILLITASGTLLALVVGALPQWHSEKWACRRNTRKVFCLTGGNGTRCVMVILGNGIGLDLEDLAGAESPMVQRRGADASSTIFGLPKSFLLTQAACLLLAALWIVFLITVTSIKQNAWYLLCVGSLGMVQNAVTAGARRSIGTSGIHLEKIEEFKREKVMHALMDLESAYLKVGKPLVHEFFPSEGGLRPNEIKWWKGEKKDYDDERSEKYPKSFAGDANASPRAPELREEHKKSFAGKT
jgi:hypothetical protein